MKRILYIYNTDITWTRRDLNILKTKYVVDPYFIGSKKDLLKILNPFKILKYDICFFWFASLNFFPVAILSKLLFRKIIVVAGGYDVAALPDIGYGAFSMGSLPRFFRRMFFSVANIIISISKSNQKEAIINANVSLSKTRLVYHGFEKQDHVLTEWKDRSKQIVTIGAFNEDTYLRKGHKYFIELASKMPEWNFKLIGQTDPVFLKELDLVKITNLELTGFVTDGALITLLNDSKFYVQLSHHEGFGCSVVEAALMGCFPIVFDRYALAEVVEGMGKVIEFGKLSVVIEFIEAGNIPVNVIEIRKHYQDKFSYNSRVENLLRTMDELY